MKKIVSLGIMVFLCSYLYGEAINSSFEGALSSGYVFKRGSNFKDVYGHGVINVITADGCFYPWDLWGVGTKLSYWRARGKTNFLKQHTLVQEMPLTFYLRRRTDLGCCLEGYASLGGGFVWLEEKSYLGKTHSFKGIGEAEIGLNYPIWRCISVVGAFRYLFPRQSSSLHEKIDVGGFDLRAGIGFSF